MKELKFHEDFINPIIEKDKISTTRIKKKNLNIGDEVKFIFLPIENHRRLNIRGIITKIEAVKFKNLNRNHANNEGYTHVDLLKHELRNIYPEIKWDTICYIYQFQLINTEDIKKC